MYPTVQGCAAHHSSGQKNGFFNVINLKNCQRQRRSCSLIAVVHYCKVRSSNLVVALPVPLQAAHCALLMCLVPVASKSKIAGYENGSTHLPRLSYQTKIGTALLCVSNASEGTFLSHTIRSNVRSGPYILIFKKFFGKLQS